MKQFINQHFNNETIAHAGIITFAVASIFNIKEYMANNGHGEPFAWALSIALGIILVSMSFMLSKSDDTNSRSFKLKFASTLSLCILSGTLQMLAYHAHGLNWLIAGLFGYGFPLVAETMLALAVAEHDKEQKIKRANDLQNNVRERIADAVADSFGAIDVSDNKSYIERQIKSVVKAQTDSIIASMMPEVRTMIAQSAEASAQNDKTLAQNTVCDIAQTGTDDNSDIFAHNRDKVNAQRTTKAQERMSQLLAILSERFDGAQSDIITKEWRAQIGEEIGVSDRTIERYLTVLENNEFISINGVIHVHAELGIPA